MEKGESLTQTALREAKEETGIKIEPRELSQPLIMHHHNKRGERIYAFFICQKWKGEPKNAEPEKCSQVGWFALNKLPGNIVPHIKKAVKNILKGNFILRRLQNSFN